MKVFLKKNLLQFIMVVGGSVAISRSPFIIGQVVAATLVLGQFKHNQKYSFKFMIFDGFKMVLVEESEGLKLNFSGFGPGFGPVF